jgi:hypothetical protein
VRERDGTLEQLVVTPVNDRTDARQDHPADRSRLHQHDLHPVAWVWFGVAVKAACCCSIDDLRVLLSSSASAHSSQRCQEPSRPCSCRRSRCRASSSRVPVPPSLPVALRWAGLALRDVLSLWFEAFYKGVGFAYLWRQNRSAHRAGADRCSAWRSAFQRRSVTAARGAQSARGGAHDESHGGHRREHHSSLVRPRHRCSAGSSVPGGAAEVAAGGFTGRDCAKALRSGTSPGPAPRVAGSASRTDHERGCYGFFDAGA